MSLFEPTKSDLHRAAECLAERILVLSALRSEAAKLRCQWSGPCWPVTKERACPNCVARAKVRDKLAKAKKLVTAAKKKMIETYQKTK
jgi:hypothetical protein